MLVAECLKTAWALFGYKANKASYNKRKQNIQKAEIPGLGFRLGSLALEGINKLPVFPETQTPPLRISVFSFQVGTGTGSQETATRLHRGVATCRRSSAL